jgi:tetratricopeptide (TPR) repeat protein
MPKGYAVQLAGGNQAEEEVPPGVAAGLFHVAGRESDLADDGREGEPGRQRSDEFGVGAGLLAPQTVVEMEHRQAELPPRSQFPQRVKEADRIGTPGDRHADAHGLSQHPVAADGIGDALKKIGQRFHCMRADGRPHRAILLTLKTPEKAGWMSYAALCAVTLAAYANSLGLGLALDAKRLVLEDSRVQEWSARNLSLILKTPYWYPRLTDRLYRPATTFSFLLNYTVLGSGTSPLGYHAVNLALHLVNVLLVFELARRAIQQRMAAWFAAALWAVHPVGTEAVANVAGRADLLAAMAVLAGLLVYIRAERAPWRIAGLLAVSMLGVAAKENAAVLPGLMLLWDWSFGGVRRRWADYAAVAAGIVAVFWMRSQMFAATQWSELQFLENPILGMTFWTGWLTAIRVLGAELWLLVWPKNLAFDYSYNQIPPAAWRDTAVWLTLAIVTAGLLAALLRRKQDPLVFFAVGFCGIALLPTSNLVVRIGSIMAVRFLYLPAVGLAIGVAGLVWRLRNRRIANGILTVVVAALGVRTVLRNPAWASDLVLASRDVETVPRSYRAHAALASTLRREDPVANANAAFEHAEMAWAIISDLSPVRRDDAVAGQLAVLCRQKGDEAGGTGTAEGRSWYLRAASLLEAAGATVDAQEAGLDAIERQQGHPLPPRGGNARVWLNLARTYAGLGRNEDALRAYRKARLEDPLHKESYREAALAEEARGDLAAAARQIEKEILVFGKDEVSAGELASLYGRMAGGPPTVGIWCEAATELAGELRAGRRIAEAKAVEAAAAGKGCGIGK